MVAHSHGSGPVFVAVDFLPTRYSQVTQQLPLLPQLRRHEPVDVLALAASSSIVAVVRVPEEISGRKEGVVRR